MICNLQCVGNNRISARIVSERADRKGGNGEAEYSRKETGLLRK